eukprot:11466261-Ditylum_brightwellii.AAC.1
MIIGQDLLKNLGIILDHATETIAWNDVSIPMKTTSARPKESFYIKDPPGVDDMVGQISVQPLLIPTYVATYIQK